MLDLLGLTHKPTQKTQPCSLAIIPTQPAVTLSLHREITLGTRAEAEGPSAQVILRLEKKAVILSAEILLMHTEGRREREREREQ